MRGTDIYVIPIAMKNPFIWFRDEEEAVFTDAVYSLYFGFLFADLVHNI